MARVYVSSTKLDLSQARELVLRAIRRLGHHALGMEDYGSFEAAPVDKCIADVKTCDYYVGIFAWRFGHIPAGHDGKSITELEYEAAGDKQIERFIYLSPERERWTNEYSDDCPDQILRLRKRLSDAHGVSVFDSAEDLRYKVAADLPREAPIPDLVPYLCNRADQLDRIQDRLEALSGQFEAPIVALLHGPDNQAHGKFVESLKVKHLPEKLGCADKPVTEIRLRWPTASTPEAVSDELNQKIARELNRGPRSVRTAAEAIAGVPGPVLISMVVPTSQWSDKDPRRLEAVVRMWEAWPRSVRVHPLLFVLYAQYLQPSGGWLGTLRRGWLLRRRNAEVRRAIEALAGDGEAENDGLLILPELRDVFRDDLEDWIALPEVREASGNSDLLEERRRLFASSDSLPMDRTAKGLREILENRSRRRLP